MSIDGSHSTTVPLVSGRPVLDLVNTVSWRGDRARARDHLESPADALVWSSRAGVLTPVEAGVLQQHVARRPAAGAALLEDLRALRTVVADAVADVAQPRTTEVESEVLAALDHSRLVRQHPESGTRGQRYRWEVTGVDEHTPRRRLALDLLDLLTVPRGPIRRCADPACGWVFEDTSRGSTRQWCSSSDCGNRNRVRQHHRRRRAASR